MSLQLDQPLWLLGLLSVPLMVAAWWHARTQRQRAATVLADLGARRWRAEESGTALLGLTGAVLLVLWAAGPRWSPPQENQWHQQDLVVVLDASASMLVEDVKPSRLERAREWMEPVGDPLGRNRVALVTFAGDARVECPWTVDRAAFQEALHNVQPASQPWGGSDLAKGISRALELLADAEQGALLLVSDGNTDDDPETRRQVLQRVREAGVRVDTLCLGTARGGPLPGQEEGRNHAARPERLAEYSTSGGEVLVETNSGSPWLGTAIPSAAKTASVPLGRWCLLLAFLAWLGECSWRGRR